jgi:general secretion pathway protein A
VVVTPSVYLRFYGLTERPFSTTPDPRFLYLGPGHDEALAQVMYGVEERMGFVLLTGEVGTGKTTLLHALRERLAGNATITFVVDPRQSFDEILEGLLEDLGLPRGEEARTAGVPALRRLLVERDRAGEVVVLILDEAHHLDVETLERIRLLSNLESSTRKLLQIALVGQPELQAKLALPELRQLTQRIAVRAVIPPLSARDTAEYIRWRLRIAGLRHPGLFTDRAVRRIAEYTAGVPRLVNIVCDHCLLIGYADERRVLDVDVVRQAIRYLDEGARRRRGRPARSGWRWPPRRRLAWAALTALLLGLVALPVLRREPFGGVPDAAGAFLESLVPSARALFSP